MEIINRVALNYNGNLIDYMLTFEGNESWSVVAGTGSGTHSPKQSFELYKSLRMQNTAPTTDLTITNNDQNTVIKNTFGVKAGLMFYLFKEDPTNAYSGNIEIFQNGNSVGIETFTLPAEGDNAWFKFDSTNTYEFDDEDVITFKFTFNGDPSFTGVKSLYIDGMHLYNKNRNDFAPPIYVLPTKNEDEPEEVLENRIIVNQSNIETTLGGLIDSSKEYFIDGVIDMGNTIIQVPLNGINIKGYDFNISKLTSSTDNYTLFYGSSAGDVIINNLGIEVSGALSKVYDLTSNTGFEAVEVSYVNYDNCTSLGELNGYRQGLEVDTGRFGGTPELTLSGNWIGGFFMTTTIVRSLTSGSYSLFKEGSSFVMNSRFKTNINADLPTGVSLLDFSALNFPNSNTIQLEDCLISRNGVLDVNDALFTPNINKTELPCLWRNNTGLPNTFVGGLMSIITEVATSITTVGVFEDLEGVYSTNDLEHFDSPVNGQLRHLGVSPNEYKVKVSGEFESTANNEIDLKIVVWDDSQGVFIDYKTQRRVVNNLQGGRDIAFFNMRDNVFLDVNDYVKFQVANVSATNNIIAELNTEFIVEER